MSAIHAATVNVLFHFKFAFRYKHAITQLIFIKIVILLRISAPDPTFTSSNVLNLTVKCKPEMTLTTIR